MDFSKTKVASAAVNHSKIDVSSTHITTASFMQLQPVYYRHMLPGEHIKGQGNVLARLSPVAVPTYGRCRINMRAFFVPFRTVFPKFNEFLVDTIASDFTRTSLVSTSPTIRNTDIYDFFMTGVDPVFNQPLIVPVTDAAAIAAGAYDFTITGPSYYRFSYYGRLFHKILQSLGYRVVWENKSSLVYSALPLLCMAKVYLDWYANSSYLNNSIYNKIEQLFNFIQPNSGLVLSYTNLSDIMTVVLAVTYDSGNDVYLNAWDNPMSPNNGLSSQFTMRDITFDPAGNVSSAVNNIATLYNPNGTPVMVQDDDSSPYIGTQYIHDLLKSMTDFVKRNQLSGAYQVDRFLSRFGINLDSAKVNRSIYVGASSVDIDFGSVTQTVNTAAAGSPSNLGDYAGQGLGRGSLDFDFKCDEFGLFVVLSSIIPAGHLYQGFDRNLLHIEKSDFYQPEFDNLGCQGISKGEVYVSSNGSYASANDYLGIFGYAPRYYEYKQKQDFVTGDFVSPAAMLGGDAWHLNRMLDDNTFSTIANQTHSFGFTQGVDAATYDRIFQYTDPDIDKFYLVFNFAAQSLAPCKSLFDTYEFDELGNQLTMDAGGAKSN